MTRMQARREGFEGPRIVAAAALAMAALCASLLAAHGAGEDGLGVLARVTARVALVIFLAAFAASPLRRIWRAPLSAWLLRNRRFVGLSFAVAHGFHLLAVLALVLLLGSAFEYDLVSLSGGGLAYLFVVLMAATSSDRAVEALGKRRWRALHRAGLHTIWIVFAVTEIPAAFDSPLHFLLAGLLVVAAGLRAAAALSQRRARDRAAPARV
jgi:DMSO/TMAO reductase YedYZ heme-binding membrane subunit